ncbi:aminoglycoside phosphotransferase (APT) family kinase protein [Cytobacillus purgationiresistens]|uniref:Aminoglycoside phosphotransferase (APT) family kinase protein n=2 Tax=Cytobacillus purgationiresistens TaxID=863449 RepID=A0ABU0AJF1_9BACI|nr:aminoglycoside phosphotransferase (APT) family kinase protein [Cytobacillus purgationiresistens]
MIKQLSTDIESVLVEKLNWQVQHLSFAANGVINAVFRVKEKELGEVALRIPWIPRENRMDGEDSSVLSLKKEAMIAQHCYQFGIPVPKIHQVYLSEDINFLVSDFIHGDEEPISSFEMGELVARIHRVPLEGFKLVDQKDSRLSDIISQRLVSRMHILRTLINEDIHTPASEDIAQILEQSSTGQVLLHLDVRPPNMIGIKGKIKALFDWDNAFIGDPIMELMRVSESCEIDEQEFIRGYGDKRLLETSSLIQAVYRLDTALMLTILFTSFVHNPMKKKYYLGRVRTLLQVVRKHM